MDEQYKKYPNLPVVGCYGFSKPLLIVKDLDLIKDITIKDFNNFSNRSFHLHASVDPLGARTMFSSRGDRWRSIRMKAATSFSSAKLRSMYPRLKAVGNEIANIFSQTTKTGE